jgi:hypothetical protein
MKGEFMKIKRWSFSNGTEIRIISAVDGHTAWKELAKIIGAKMWHGGFEIMLPNKWNINCVCICGKTQATSYCSKVCAERKNK